MEHLNIDLRGVVVYMDDILLSGNNAQEHLDNFRVLFRRINEKGLCCNLEKCIFVQQSVEYSGHTMSKEGIAKGPKLGAVLSMPSPTKVGTL